jgi:glyoxylate reductase
MPKPKIFITRPIPQKGLDMLSPAAEIDLWPHDLPPDTASLFEKVKGIDGLLCLLTDRIDAPVMDAAGDSLKVISQMAVGYDNIDIPAATQRHIPVGNTPGVLTEATADFTWALLMAAARRVVEADKFTRAGHWKTWGPTLLLGPEVYGSTLGIVGLGRIGQAVAKRARGFDMRVLYHSRNRRTDLEDSLGLEYASFDTLLHDSDFVSPHMPLTAETRHLFNDDAFGKMKPGAVFINTTRGPVVDHAALHRALTTGTIAYAALDVTDPEPIPLDSPLLGLDNIIIAPHIASAGLKTRDQMATMAAANLIAGLRGERLPNCVNPKVYDE